MATVLSTRPTGIPSLLTLVSRVRQEVTKESLTTLTDDPVNNVIVHALNDAMDDIYARLKWNWSKVVGNLVMVANQSDYPLPADFYRMASEPEVGTIKFREVDSEEWTYYTSNANLGSNLNISGAPRVYMVDRSFVRFYPTPSSDFVSQVPTIGIFYYKRPAARLILTLDAASAFDIPVQFQEALHRYAVSRLKVFYNKDDWRVDMDRYEFLISQQIQNDTQSVHPPRVRPRNRYSANFG